MSLAELEAQLAGSWDREQLVVYADALQSAGDPRGELIAFDLHTDAFGADANVDERRRELARAWLGALALEPGVDWRYGFLEVTLDDTSPATAARLLAAPYGRYVRSVIMDYGQVRKLRRAMELLLAEPRPWLTRLRVDAKRVRSGGPIFDGATSAALVDAAPRLRRLAVHGEQVFVGLVHPSVRRMHVTGFDAMSSLARSGAAHTALVELDLELGGTYGPALSPQQIEELLPAIRLPALRTLDLSRAGWYGIGRPPPYDEHALALLRAIAVRPLGQQITHLRISNVTSDQVVARLQPSIERLASLRELQAEGHADYAARLRHPSARIVHADRSWDLPSTSCHAQLTLDLEPPVSLSQMLSAMLHAYRGLSIIGRVAWAHLHDFLEHLEDEDDGSGIARTFSSAMLAQAIEAMPDFVQRARWLYALDELRTRDSVTIRRFWT